jgi:hypothetical protein
LFDRHVFVFVVSGPLTCGIGEGVVARPALAAFVTGIVLLQSREERGFAAEEVLVQAHGLQTIRMASLFQKSGVPNPQAFAAAHSLAQFENWIHHGGEKKQRNYIGQTEPFSEPAQRQ